MDEMKGRWFNGPDFLQLREELWPVEDDKPDLKEVNKEKRKIEVACAAAVTEPVVNCQDFSTWRRLLRVTAYVIRFCRNIRTKSSRDKEHNQIYVDPLNAEEIERAEEYWHIKLWVGILMTIDPKFRSFYGLSYC